jgi:hypothetical protein
MSFIFIVVLRTRKRLPPKDVAAVKGLSTGRTLHTLSALLAGCTVSNRISPRKKRVGKIHFLPLAAILTHNFGFFCFHRISYIVVESA